MANERAELLTPEEDAIYIRQVEDILNISLDALTFEKIAWLIVDGWQRDVMEGPPEHREKLQNMRDMHNRYITYLLRNDLDRAKVGSPYPRPTTPRMSKVWKVAETLYFADDPSGFLGPSASEIVYVARAIVLAVDLGNTDFEPELVRKLWDSAFWPYGDIDDPDFTTWLDSDGMYKMFEHRGKEMIWDDSPVLTKT